MARRDVEELLSNIGIAEGLRKNICDYLERGAENQIIREQLISRGLSEDLVLRIRKAYECEDDYERGWEDGHCGIKKSPASPDYNAGWYDAKTAQAINSPNPFDSKSYPDNEKK